MSTLVIKGHSTRGKEVIEILEMLGGNNLHEYVADSDCFGFYIGNIKYDEFRFATEEEKEKLFQVIEENGYRWNAETKTMEKLVEPKFKVGDRIRHKENTRLVCTIARVEDRYYVDEHPTCYTILFDSQDEYELASDKFDINTLKPFESRVLVRDYDNRIWTPAFWGKHLEDYSSCSYLTTIGCHKYCIPYEGNEHLLGTSNDCDEYYNTWKK